MKEWLPLWAQEWFGILVPGLQILLILFLAWLVQRMLRRFIWRIGERYRLPMEVLIPLRGVLTWLIMGSAILMVLERLGVSATVLWTAITGFAAVAAVAFFAAWSVLSNLFCALLIFTVGPFRLGDRLELLDAADKPGVKGRVVSINMLYTTLEDLSEESDGALVQIPNTLFFQKVMRRWRGTELPPLSKNEI
ncbi:MULTISPECIES: mechanosensitive ion channel family protein [Pseudomonas]|jgi:small-conductance mechanosensitive channel|uniref:Small-conductance mechanosensitive channel n=1 Tax=Serpens gallinarum TaxID=2763075 RepID=A0ABR8TMD5_9PSED|nr:mechanosensitive ion channel family protein [Serpens gallinarum]MBD7976913.1 mechanosensitive ion channel family protein [Serpens gallinarum]